MKERIRLYKIKNGIPLLILLSLCGCIIPRGIPVEMYSKVYVNMEDNKEKEVKKGKVRFYKDRKKTIIIAIVIEINVTQSQAYVLWDNYERSGIKGFYNYLVTNNIFWQRDDLNKRLIQLIKARTKILKRLTQK